MAKRMTYRGAKSVVRLFKAYAEYEAKTETQNLRERADELETVLIAQQVSPEMARKAAISSVGLDLSFQETLVSAIRSAFRRDDAKNSTFLRMIAEAISKHIGAEDTTTAKDDNVLLASE